MAPPDAAQVEDEQGQGQHPEPVPGIGDPEQAVGGHAGPSEDHENGLVDLRPPFAEPDRDGHAVLRVSLHVPYIVDIQYTHAQETRRSTGQ